MPNKIEGCTLAEPGRGDCEHAVGLPGHSIPGQHDGPDDTVDAYGKPNGWCWSCWKSHKIGRLENEIEHTALILDYHTNIERPGYTLSGRVRQLCDDFEALNQG